MAGGCSTTSGHGSGDWDARPFPAFPLQGNVWADGSNWHFGHWLNGRLEAPDLGSLINALLADHGLPAADVSLADGALQGYVVDEPGSVRSALEPLADLFGLAICEDAAGLTFRSMLARPAEPLAIDEMVVEDGGATVERVREPDHELPAEAVLVFRDHLSDFQTGSARSLRAGASGRLQRTLSFPGILERGQGTALVTDWHRRLWAGRESVPLSLANYRAGFEPGAVITLTDAGGSEFLVTEVEDGLVRRLKARRIDRAVPAAWTTPPQGAGETQAIHAGRPYALFLDLPARTASTAAQDHFRIAMRQKPWKSQVLLASPEDTGFTLRATIDRPADLGELLEPLPAGAFEGRVDHAKTIRVALFDAEAASVSRLQLLNGANVAAVRSNASVWEVLQFETADEISSGVWLLSGLLRGQLGTGDAMASGAAVGAPFVLLNDRVKSAGLFAGEIGLPLNWRVGPSGAVISEDTFADHSEAGGLRARLPLAPVHLRCRPGPGGDLAFSWVRRGRIDADDWAATDIPLGEEREEYRIDVSAVGEPVVRSETVAVSNWTYAGGDIVAGFGGMPAEIDIAVRQLSLSAGWGIPASRRFSL